MNGLRRVTWAVALLWIAGPLLIAVMARPAHALEVYGLLTRTCTQHIGLIVHADGLAVFLLTPQGRLQAVSRSEVSRILVYNTLDNPIPVLLLSEELGALAQDVRLDGDTEEQFVGWPIRFEEEAIIFFDMQGKTHIENLERIVAIRPARNLPARQDLPEAKPQNFRLGPNVADCPEPPDSSQPAVYPTRVIADQININRFLAAFNNGFRDLERFRQRTAFYARPFLYDPWTKLGLQLGDFELFPLVELNTVIPLYFQWSSGRNYASQGLIVLGSKPIEWLPNVEPVFSLRSDVKSGFFSASFVGNPLAFAAGDSFVVTNRFFYEDYFKSLSERDILVFSHFNHLALTGMDWGPYTFSAGYYYPLTGLYGGGRFREVLSTSPSTLWRLLYTTPHLQTRLLYSATLLGSKTPTGEDIQLIEAAEMRSVGAVSAESLGLVDQLQRFSLDSRFLRLGGDWDLPYELQVGVDQILFEGVYREYFEDGFYRVNYLHHVTSVHVGQSFSSFVALRAYLNAFQRHYESHAETGRDDRAYQDLSFTVAIEFVL